MGVIDTEQLLGETAEEPPCGPNLEGDPRFVELEQAARGRPEQVMGDQTIPAEPPDWKKVRDIALSLSAESRDLRVAVLLARALTSTAGLLGLADALELIRGLLERHWDSVHPQLDPDDDNDPLIRINTLIALCDKQGLVRDLAHVPLVQSRALGSFSLRATQLSSGSLSPVAGEQVHDPAAIDGAFMEANLEQIQSDSDAATRALDAAVKIDQELTGRVGADRAPDMAGLTACLREIVGIYSTQLSRRGVVASGGEPDNAPVAGDTVEAGPAAQATAAVSVPGAVNSREEVVRILDRICEFYARQEPSSPVPVLLQRAKRLVSKDFLEILKDVAPDSVAQFERLSGADSGKD